MSRSTSFILVTVAYVLATLVGWLAVTHAPVESAVWRLLVADVAATLVIFAASRIANNTSMYDAYWSVAPPLLAVWIMSQVGAGPRTWLVMPMVLLWAVRLTYNWVRGWAGVAHEDWRFINMRRSTGKLYWWVSLLALHLIPTAIVYLGSWPLWPALTQHELNFIDVAAVIIGYSAVVLEAVADQQLWRFRRDPANAGQAIAQGLWRNSRHPNYLGEIGFWWGIALFGFAADNNPIYFAGALTITAMFVFATIPMAEKHALARRPEYAARMRTTRMLFPIPRG